MSCSPAIDWHKPVPHIIMWRVDGDSYLGSGLGAELPELGHESDRRHRQLQASEHQHTWLLADARLSCEPEDQTHRTPVDMLGPKDRAAMESSWLQLFPALQAVSDPDRTSLRAWNRHILLQGLGMDHTLRRENCRPCGWVRMSMAGSTAPRLSRGSPWPMKTMLVMSGAV